MPNKKGKTMKAWPSITHYAGSDWAREHHAVVIVDRQGQSAADFEFEHTQADWQSLPQPGSPPAKVCYDYLAQPSIAKAGLAPASMSKTEGCT